MTQIILTEADKERAVELAHALNISCEDFTSGAADLIVRLIARHALAARIEALEEAAKVADAHSRARRNAAAQAKAEKRRSEARDHESMAIEAMHITIAIRSLIPTGAE